MNKFSKIVPTKNQTAAFSLFELLITLMIIGVMILLVLNVYSFIGPEAKDVVDRRNAKIIIATHRQAVMAGASFSDNTRDDVLRELVQGVRPKGIFRDRIFRVSGLNSEALSRAARFLSIDEGGSLQFDAQASQPSM